MIAWSACILAAACFVLLAAYWFANVGARHARRAADCLRDVKRAVARWSKAAGIAVDTSDLQGEPEQKRRPF